MKIYKLKKGYPSLPAWMKEGQEVAISHERNTYVAAPYKYVISAVEVENNPEFWEEVKAKEEKISGARMFLLLSDRTMVDIEKEKVPLGILLATVNGGGKYYDDSTGIWYFLHDADRLKFFMCIKRPLPLFGLCGVKFKNPFSPNPTWLDKREDKTPKDSPAMRTLYCVDKKTLTPFEVKSSGADCVFIDDTKVFSTVEERDKYILENTPIDISEALKSPIPEIWYCVDKDFNPFEITTSDTCSRARKVYASKELRDKYIQENKPQFSMLDMLSFAKSFYSLYPCTDDMLRRKFTEWEVTGAFKNK